jgi:hypothetical protein
MNWNRNLLESFQLRELAYDNMTLTCTWDHARETGWEFYCPVGTTPEQIRQILEGVRR